jgi:hypothetical protein
MLSLILVAAASCADITGAGDVSTSDTSSSTSALPQIEPFEGFFTGVVTAVTDTTVSLDVCEPYLPTLGEKITVSTEKLSGFEVNKGDEIRVVLDTDLKETPEMHIARYIQVIDSDEGRTPLAPGTLDKLGITPIDEVRIMDSFPTAEEMRSKEFPKVSASWTKAICRVADIKNDTVYLVGIYEKSVSAAIVGIPNFSFGVGDYIQISSTVLYDAGSYNYRMTYAKNVTSIKILSAQEVFSLYVAMDKPVIYLYPEKETECSVKVNLNGKITCTYPEHGAEGWQNFTAMPDGTLVFNDGKEYYCLYWEGMAHMTPDFSKGFCVKGSDTAAFLEKILPEIGLNAREANEFIIYWLPLLQKNEYNLISFQGKQYTDMAELEIEPAPDSVLRVYMSVKPLDSYVEIAPQEFDGFERKGFTVVEWGGGIMAE